VFLSTPSASQVQHGAEQVEHNGVEPVAQRCQRLVELDQPEELRAGESGERASLSVCCMGQLARVGGSAGRTLNKGLRGLTAQGYSRLSMIARIRKKSTTTVVSATFQLSVTRSLASVNNTCRSSPWRSISDALQRRCHMALWPGCLQLLRSRGWQRSLTPKSACVKPLLELPASASPSRCRVSSATLREQ
jgi:hypothetical protein